MLLKEKKLSSFSVGSFGGGGGVDGEIPHDIDNTDLVTRAIYLFNRVSALEAKMSELYMRPRMDYTDLADSGWVLEYDPPSTLRIAPNKPRWATHGITSARRTDTNHSDTTGIRTELTNYNEIDKQEFIHSVPHNRKDKQRYVYYSSTPSGAESPVYTTTTTNTVGLPPTAYITTTTPRDEFIEGTIERRTVTGTVTETTVSHFTNGAWLETDYSKNTTWPEGDTPGGTYTTTKDVIVTLEPIEVTDPTVTTTVYLIPDIWLPTT